MWYNIAVVQTAKDTGDRLTEKNTVNWLSFNFNSTVQVNVCNINFYLLFWSTYFIIG